MRNNLLFSGIKEEWEKNTVKVLQTSIKWKSRVDLTFSLNGGIELENGLSITYTRGMLWQNSPTCTSKIES